MISRRNALKLGVAGLAIPSLRLSGTDSRPVQAQNSDGNVAMYRGNAARTGMMPGPGPSLDKPIIVAWEFETAAWVTSTPAVVNNIVYVGSEDNTFYAIDAATGDEQWRFDTDWYVISSPAVANGVVYFGGQNGTVYALDVATGAVRWQAPLGEYIRSSPAIVENTVYIGCGDSCLYALDAESGDERWRFPTIAPISSSPAVSSGIVYVASSESNLYAIDAVTGAQRWQTYIGEWLDVSPAIADGTVFIGGFDNHLLALDATTGAERWRYATGGTIHSSPAVVNGSVYIGSDDHSLHAVDATTGHEKWRFGTEGVVQKNPTVAGDTIYIGCNDGNLYAIDTSTGVEQWRFSTEMFFASSVTVANGTVYVGSGDSHLYALANLENTQGYLREDVTLRGAPSESGIERGTAQAGVEIDDIGDRISANGREWAEVTIGDVTGWIPLDAIEPAALPPEGEIEYVYIPERMDHRSVPPATNSTITTNTIYDSSSIRSTLPTIESMPGSFEETGDSPQDLASVTEALGGGIEVETMLADLGWQASMSRLFLSSDPDITGSRSIIVVSHAFKDQPSAQTALTQFASIHSGYGWNPGHGQQHGNGSETLLWRDQGTNEDAVSIFVVVGQLLYRVFATGPYGFDSTPNAIFVVERIAKA